MKTVEIVPAFLWTCDVCGRDNFERAILIPPQAIKQEDIEFCFGENAQDLDEWIRAGGQGDWIKAPGTVKCRHCNEEFETEPI